MYSVLVKYGLYPLHNVWIISKSCKLFVLMCILCYLDSLCDFQVSIRPSLKFPVHIPPPRSAHTHLVKISLLMISEINRKDNCKLTIPHGYKLLVCNDCQANDTANLDIKNWALCPVDEPGSAATSQCTSPILQVVQFSVQQKQKTVQNVC
jgi:hypothetical protein